MEKKANEGEKEEKEETDLLELRFIDWETIAPSRHFFEMWDEMDKMMDEIWGARHLGRPFQPMAELTRHIPRMPVLDIMNAGNEYHLDVEMPGISKEDVEIEVSDNTIEISAESVKEDKKEGKTCGSNAIWAGPTGSSPCRGTSRWTRSTPRWSTIMISNLVHGF